jgi:putative iron-dependent peroxidase
MAHPQQGLLVQGVSEHRHSEFRVDTNADPAELRRAVAHARRRATALSGPNVTWGFSPRLWSILAPSGLPPTVTDFQGVTGKGGLSAPATQYDIWVWVSGCTATSVAVTIGRVNEALAGVAVLEQELQAYTHADSRDPTGFIDGTENPLLDEAVQVALFPEGATGAGGAAVLVQKWVHRLEEFEALPVSAQEDVFGRTKQDSIQLPDASMPPTSHVSRNTIVDAEGNERHIYRRNTPYASATQTGTLFIGATNDPPLMIEMLERMFGASGDGLIDHVVLFSDAVTGSWYFVPSFEELTTAFGPLKDDDSSDSELVEPLVMNDGGSGHLNIGSLRA